MYIYVICTDFEKTRNTIRRELYKHYRRDSDEPSITIEIKAQTIKGSNIKESTRGNIRLVENTKKTFIEGYIYSRLNPYENDEIRWINPIDWTSGDSKIFKQYYQNTNNKTISKIIIVGQDSLQFYSNVIRKLLNNEKDIEIKVEV